MYNSHTYNNSVEYIIAYWLKTNSLSTIQWLVICVRACECVCACPYLFEISMHEIASVHLFLNSAIPRDGQCVDGNIERYIILILSQPLVWLLLFVPLFSCHFPKIEATANEMKQKQIPNRTNSMAKALEILCCNMLVSVWNYNNCLHGCTNISKNRPRENNAKRDQ